MRYASPEAFRTALDQRLKNEAAKTGIALMRLRKMVAFDRFLARRDPRGSRRGGPREGYGAR